MKVLYYHGLGGEAPMDLISKFRELGLELICKTHDYEKEYDSDLGKSMMEREFNNENIDFVIGNSFGGYVGYHVAKKLNVPMLLLNPAIDRSVTKTGIYDFDFEVSINEPRIHLALGKYDNLVNPNLTISYLNKNGIDYTFSVANMEHNITYQDLIREVIYFKSIVKNERAYFKS